MTTGRRHVCTCAVPVWRFDPPRGHRLSFGKPPPPQKKNIKTIPQYVHLYITVLQRVSALPPS